VLEVRTGIESLDPGDRRVALDQAFDALLRSDLEERILAFDVAAANVAGTIAGARRRAGRTIEVRDIQIACIAMVRHATLATRNTRHFEGLGLPLVDPWGEGAPATGD
jgi:predicted nucleic acid-binding protein